MLVPRFTIRWVVWLTTVLALLFVVVRQAFLEADWAIAMSVVFLLVAGIFLFFGVTFVLAYGLARFTRTLTPPQAPENPFVVEGQYPPQEVPRNPYGQDQT